MTTTKQTTSHLIESNNIFICDFNDSFTYNIYSDLFRLKQKVIVRSFKDITFWKQLRLKLDKFILILGPGPGHPSDYRFSHFQKIISNRNCFVLGICLGHQLLLSSLGATVKSSINKSHGQQVEIYDKEGLIFKKGFKSKFQRYNSLTVDLSSLVTTNAKYLLDLNGELMIFKDDRIFSCQFHPESVGTNCPNSVYSIALKFLI